jgi:predicted nucleic acid-binding protein
MRNGFSPLINPATKVSEHKGTPTAHARQLAADIAEARNVAEERDARDAALDFADGTTFVPDRRYLDKVLSS